MIPEFNVKYDMELDHYAVFDGKQFFLSHLTETQAEAIAKAMNEQRAKIRHLLRIMSNITLELQKYQGWL